MYKTIESNMIFGPFEETDIFEIEKSNVNQMIGQHIRTVEFIMRREGKQQEEQILFIEAKSSTPRQQTSKIRYDEFITEISEKFIQSFEIYHALKYNRYRTDVTMGEHLMKQEWDKVHIKFVLIIHGHKMEWLPPLREALMKNMNIYLKIWKSTIVVLNDEMAKSYKLISETI